MPQPLNQGQIPTTNPSANTPISTQDPPQGPGQLPLGGTSNDAMLMGQHPHIPATHLLGLQYQLPRAQPDANMSDRPGLNTGES